jgi:ATP-dependent DNA helicase RecQ
MVFADILESNGFHARPYHAGMSNNDRESVQDWFMQTSFENRIVVATIAFGMGIDKRNIRFVYHAVMAKSLEGYSQEIGRAGRDGAPSVCKSFMCADDLPLLKAFAFGDTPSMTTCSQVLLTVFMDEFNAFRERLCVAEINHYSMVTPNLNPREEKMICERGLFSLFLSI